MRGRYASGIAAIGLSAGAGMYVVSAAATLFGVVALAVLRRFEHKDDRLLRRKISIVLSEGGPPLSAILAALAGAGVLVSPAEYEKHVEEHRVYVTLQAEVPAGESDRLLALLESQPGLQRIRVEPIA